MEIETCLHTVCLPGLQAFLRPYPYAWLCMRCRGTSKLEIMPDLSGALWNSQKAIFLYENYLSSTEIGISYVTGIKLTHLRVLL